MRGRTNRTRNHLYIMDSSTVGSPFIILLTVLVSPRSLEAWRRTRRSPSISARNQAVTRSTVWSRTLRRPPERSGRRHRPLAAGSKCLSRIWKTTQPPPAAAFHPERLPSSATGHPSERVYPTELPSERTGRRGVKYIYN